MVNQHVRDKYPDLMYTTIKVQVNSNTQHPQLDGSIEAYIDFLRWYKVMTKAMVLSSYLFILEMSPLKILKFPLNCLAELTYIPSKLLKVYPCYELVRSTGTRTCRTNEEW